MRCKILSLGPATAWTKCWQVTAWGWTARCGRPPLLLPSCRKLEFRLSALIDSDLAWLNGKSGRQSWCYADAFQRSIISEAIYHLLQPASSTRNQLNGSYRLNRRALTARQRRVARGTGRYRHQQRLTDYRRICPQQNYTTSFRLLLPVPSDDNEWQTLLNTNRQTVAITADMTTM